jgi:hypothetical protein
LRSAPPHYRGNFAGQGNEDEQAANPRTIAAELVVSERILPFCLTFDTDWKKAALLTRRRQHMVRGLIERTYSRLGSDLQLRSSRQACSYVETSSRYDQHRIVEAKPFDAVRDLANLLPRVGPRIASIRLQLADKSVFDVHRAPLFYCVLESVFQI